MEKRTMLFKAYYSFSKKIAPWNQRKMKKEYFRLRNIAVPRLNALFPKWNAEFEERKIHRRDDDPLYEYGGTEYCDFIRKKERHILVDVNSVHATRGVYLDADEIGDLIVVNRRGDTLTVEFEPIKEIEAT